MSDLQIKLIASVNTWHYCGGGGSGTVLLINEKCASFADGDQNADDIVKDADAGQMGGLKKEVCTHSTVI